MFKIQGKLENSKHESKNGKNNELKAENINLTEKVKVLQSEIENLNQENKRKNQTKFNNQNFELEKEKETLFNENSNLKEQIFKIQEKLENLEYESQNLQTIHENAKRKMQKSSISTESETKSLMENNEILTNEISILQKLQGELVNQNNTFRETIEILNEEKKKQKNKISNLETKVEKYKPRFLLNGNQ